MQIIYKRLYELDFTVRTLCYSHNGWLVGGGAKYLLGIYDKKPRDWDILIPLENWNQAALSFPRGSLTNNFGGVKLNVDDVEIDVWGDSLSNFILNADTDNTYAVNLTNFSVIHINKRAINYDK